MDIKELSVGDWVQDRKGAVAQIIGIEEWSGSYELHIRLNGIDVGLAPALGCYPIPLTPEILEKNGWDGYSDAHNSWKFDVSGNIRVWMFKNSHDWTFQVMDWGLGHNHCTAKAYIEHVHHLQHALRLAGIDKEIEL